MALITISHNMLAVYSLRVFSSSFLNYFTTLYQEALADFVFIVGERRYLDISMIETVYLPALIL
jgi:hypothetical protein